jgi:hypothetical protein
VWDGDRPHGDHQAGAVYDDLYERYLESDAVVAPPVPRITASRTARPTKCPSTPLRWLVHTDWSASIRRENACGRELLLLGDGFRRCDRHSVI